MDNGFWLYLTIVEMVIPVAMIGIGFRMTRKPPITMASPIGYRTKRAKKNQDTWEFAQNHCGKIWYMLGIAMAILTLSVMQNCKTDAQDVVGMIAITVVLVQICALIVSCLPTELALRRRFDAEGNRRF